MDNFDDLRAALGWMAEGEWQSLPDIDGYCWICDADRNGVADCVEGKLMNRMTRRSLYGCRNVPNQRWGQAICNQFRINRGELAEQLYYETDEEKVKAVVEKMILDYNLPEK